MERISLATAIGEIVTLLVDRMEFKSWSALPRVARDFNVCRQPVATAFREYVLAAATLAKR